MWKGYSVQQSLPFSFKLALVAEAGLEVLLGEGDSPTDTVSDLEVV